MRLLLIAFDPLDAVAGAGFAQQFGAPFDIVQVTGAPVTDLGAGTVHSAGLETVPVADALAEAVLGLAREATHTVAVSAMRSKDVLARLAGHLDAAMVTDVVAFESPTVFHRPMVAGTVVATVEVLETPVVLTLRPAGFNKADRSGESAVQPLAVGEGRAVRLSQTVRGGSRPDLSQAKTVVSGGRPMKDAETFERVIGGLADKLGGAAGATRAAVDSGIAPNELQVGQTGKIVAPDLYIAAGVSGSTQHMAGIKDSKVIVAINKDPDAPIFEIADFGLVADLYEAIPELMQKL